MEAPARSGQSWSTEEENALLKDLSCGLSLKEIAKNLHRTIGGISARRKHIARRLVRNGMPLSEIAKITRLSIDDIQTSIKSSETMRRDKKAETLLLDVVIEIRDLLRQLVHEREPQQVEVPTTQRRNSVTIKL